MFTNLFLFSVVPLLLFFITRISVYARINTYYYDGISLLLVASGILGIAYHIPHLIFFSTLYLLIFLISKSLPTITIASMDKETYDKLNKDK